MTLSAHGPLRIKDAWVLNHPEPGKITISVSAETLQQRQYQQIGMKVDCELIDPATGKVIATPKLGGVGGSTDALHAGSGRPWPPEYLQEVLTRPLQLAGTITISDIKPWTLEDPKLYHLRITASRGDGNTDTRTIAFGFRSFAPTGIGTNAVFRLNNRRIKLYYSISWGFWGLNGLFPTPELAEKEVTQAKKLNLNCLNFHRNLAKEEVLRAHDRLGLLRYMEPGAGKMAIGKLPANTAASANSVVMEKPADDADRFAQRFMFVKCVEMVKAYRSHPSVIIYCLQNEIGADLENPDTIAILKAMHTEDPSRCVVLNDGFVAPPRRAAQAWYEPWDSEGNAGKLHRIRRRRVGRLVESTPGRGRPMVRRVLQIADRLHLQSPLQKRPHRVRRDGGLRHARQPLPHDPPDHRNLPHVRRQ